MNRTIPAAAAALALLLSPSPAAAQVVARVCTRHPDGMLNIRALLSTSSPIIGRLRNGQAVILTGWVGRPWDGYRWYQLPSGGWVRGDYLCPAGAPSHGPGSF